MHGLGRGEGGVYCAAEKCFRFWKKLGKEFVGIKKLKTKKETHKSSYLLSRIRTLKSTSNSQKHPPYSPDSYVYVVNEWFLNLFYLVAKLFTIGFWNVSL